jgi:hypothetical protein
MAGWAREAAVTMTATSRTRAARDERLMDKVLLGRAVGGDGGPGCLRPQAGDDTEM